MVDDEEDEDGDEDEGENEVWLRVHYTAGE